ncbi:sigma 54-interacting transcriptional regulator [Sporolituus thermophilus]|uniref:PAS domain S-box-containing protein n=1 Tax=Sporolituus thermophilus DSM 23256 TaxID=1123285 RepID=A0A1G7NHW6_9FIRM|nr:sigma 54-interacting transcriptional regulator [Sporolituus thermophilus]SDF73678.1 PAS domain S-box-containing protein [Sporolituus thermophilus DSM 23256]
MKPRIAIIAPYPALKAEAEAVVADLGAHVAVYEGDLDDGVQAARQAVAGGAEVIISRGGTARLIARTLDIPVVEIKVSPFDILRCLAQLREYKGKIGIIGFSNVVYGCESIGAVLGLELKQIIIDSRDDAPGKIAAAAQAGIELVVGDAISIKQATRLGLKGVLITSGKEAIVQAIHEAENIAEVRISERERAELFRIIVNSSHDGIIAIDDTERITLFNPVAEKVFGIPAAAAVGAKIRDIIPNTNLPRILRQGGSEYGELQYVGDKVIVTRRFAINVNGRVVGAVANFRDVTELERLERLVRQKLHAKGLVARIRLEDIIGESTPLKGLIERAKKFATVDATVLIVGETGTGKEMLAQGIHNASHRANGPFVAVNCAALPENLLESELFGYAEGAFTGAKKGGKPGLFELAHGGTIFLDEISEMPLPLQSRLLRVLQEREVLRIGGDRIIPVDVRIIAASNRNLRNLVEKGLFRDDLYYRLHLLTLTAPPLRERKEDIPLLVRAFLRKHSQLNPLVGDIDPLAVKLLAEYDWPGNIRELENAMQRLIILSEEPIIGEAAVSALLEELQVGHRELPIPGEQATPSLADLEAQYIAAVLAEENNNKSRAAKRLGIDRSTLWRKLRGVEKSNNTVE